MSFPMLPYTSPRPALIQNGFYVPEDDVYVVSTRQHDYRTHTFRDSLTLAADGGRAYCRRAGDFIKLEEAGRYVECCLTDDLPFDYIAEKLLWGSTGKSGTEPMTFRPIKEWAYKPDGVAHLRAILKNVPDIEPFRKRVIEHWLAVRAKEDKENPTS